MKDVCTFETKSLGVDALRIMLKSSVGMVTPQYSLGFFENQF